MRVGQESLVREKEWNNLPYLTLERVIPGDKENGYLTLPYGVEEVKFQHSCKIGKSFNPESLDPRSRIFNTSLSSTPLEARVPLKKVRERLYF